MKLWILLICSFITKIANCCSCTPLGAIDDKQYNDYNLIAKGKIAKVVENSFKRIIYLKVDTYYKGEEKEQTIIIESPSESGMCGIFPKIGESWLMFAYISGKVYKTYLCTRTKNMNPKAWDYRKEEVKEDIDFLETKRKNSYR